MSQAMVCDACGDALVESAPEAAEWLVVRRRGGQTHAEEPDPLHVQRDFCSLKCAATWLAMAVDGAVMEPPDFVRQTHRRPLELPATASVPPPPTSSPNPWAEQRVGTQRGRPATHVTEEEGREGAPLPESNGTGGEGKPRESVRPKLSELISGTAPAVDLRTLDTSRAKNRDRRR